MSHDIVRFSLDGVRVDLHCADRRVRAFLARDFSQFRIEHASAADAADVRQRIILQE